MTSTLTRFLIKERINQVLPFIKGAVLDLGCGSAPILPMLPATEVYVGVDAYPEGIARLKQIYQNREFICLNLDQQPLNIERRFDTVLMTAVIEHLSEPERILSQLPRLLNPGGRLLITTPTPIGHKVYHLGAKLGTFSQVADDDHKYIFNRQLLSNMLDQSGLLMVDYHLFLIGQNQFCAAQAKSDFEVQK